MIIQQISSYGHRSCPRPYNAIEEIQSFTGAEERLNFAEENEDTEFITIEENLTECQTQDKVKLDRIPGSQEDISLNSTAKMDPIRDLMGRFTTQEHKVIELALEEAKKEVKLSVPIQVRPFKKFPYLCEKIETWTQPDSSGTVINHDSDEEDEGSQNVINLIRRKKKGNGKTKVKLPSYQTPQPNTRYGAASYNLDDPTYRVVGQVKLSQVKNSK